MFRNLFQNVLSSFGPQSFAQVKDTLGPTHAGKDAVHRAAVSREPAIEKRPRDIPVQ